jgi:hypothetical protein
MSDEGMEIPFEADLAPLQAAIDRVVAAIDKMATTITSAFDRANTSINASVSKMNAFQTGTSSAAAASHQMSQASATMSAKIMQAASAAGTLGHAAAGIKEGLSAASSAARYLRNTNLGSTLTSWITRAGGIRSAFRQIPSAMSAIASNPVFRRVAAGAVIAVGGILAIRTAWRTVTGAFSLARNTITSSFRGIVTAARSAAAQAGNAFKGLASMPGKLMGSMGGAMPFAGVIGGLGGLAAAATLAVSAVNKAAEMETLETAFAPLIGGSENAKKRIKELANFAAATPFELPEIAKGSRVLETLTKGALSTGEGLRMVGDVAAATQQPFEEIAMWVGRLYDGLQSGRPVGEAMMRLQELGVVSGDVRARLEAMQKTGAAGNAIWGEAAAALNRFSGSMERQSVTWSGKLSTLRDNITQVLAAFGTPIIDGLKPYLDMAIAKVGSLQSAAETAGQKIRNALDAGIAAWQTGLIAETLGAGLQVAIIRGINSLSSGIRQVMAYMAGAMDSIMGDMRNSWGAQELIGIFEDLGKGLAAAIAAGILRGIDAIPGVNTTQDANREGNAAKNSFRRASNRLEDINLGDTIQGMINSLRKANDKGMQAAAKAIGEPLIDGTNAENKWKKIVEKLNEQMEKNRKAIDDAQKKMDDRLQNPTGLGGVNGPAAAISKAAQAAQPAVTSLGRIGGGGFTGISPMIGEQRKTNGILTRIENKLGKGNPVPVIA